MGVGRAAKKEGYDHSTHQVLDIILAKTNKVCTVTMPILQMGKLRHREVKELALSRTPDK